MHVPFPASKQRGLRAALTSANPGRVKNLFSPIHALQERARSQRASVASLAVADADRYRAWPIVPQPGMESIPFGKDDGHQERPEIAWGALDPAGNRILLLEFLPSDRRSTRTYPFLRPGNLCHSRTMFGNPDACSFLYLPRREIDSRYKNFIPSGGHGRPRLSTEAPGGVNSDI